MMNAEEMARRRFDMNNAYFSEEQIWSMRQGYVVAIQENIQPLKDQRDELLEAIQLLLDAPPSGCVDHIAIERKARAAIAKCTPKE